MGASWYDQSRPAVGGDLSCPFSSHIQRNTYIRGTHGRHIYICSTSITDLRYIVSQCNIHASLPKTFVSTISHTGEFLSANTAVPMLGKEGKMITNIHMVTDHQVQSCILEASNTTTSASCACRCVQSSSLHSSHI